MSGSPKRVSKKPSSRYATKREFEELVQAFIMVLDAFLDAGQVSMASRSTLLAIRGALEQEPLPYAKDTGDGEG